MGIAKNYLAGILVVVCGRPAINYQVRFLVIIKEPQIETCLPFNTGPLQSVDGQS